ncbi:hypothetical protein TNCV_89231 [Trichonephila clavipes]|nr:hypothetical protein TNCV_89231 [Trichonephila clavipes]
MKTDVSGNPGFLFSFVCLPSSCNQPAAVRSVFVFVCGHDVCFLLCVMPSLLDLYVFHDAINWINVPDCLVYSIEYVTSTNIENVSNIQSFTRHRPHPTFGSLRTYLFPLVLKNTLQHILARYIVLTNPAFQQISKVFCRIQIRGLRGYVQLIWDIIQEPKLHNISGVLRIVVVLKTKRLSLAEFGGTFL